MEPTYRNDCAICGEPVDDDEVIAIRHASATVAHDSHSARQVREARIAAGADPDTAQDVVADPSTITPAEVDRIVPPAWGVDDVAQEGLEL